VNSGCDAALTSLKLSVMIGLSKETGFAGDFLYTKVYTIFSHRGSFIADTAQGI
jgi:hypothetical protein